MKTAQIFFEDCVGPSKLNLIKFNPIKSDFQRVRVFFLFLSIFGEVGLLCCVLFCKKGKLTSRIKCEKVS